MTVQVFEYYDGYDALYEDEDDYDTCRENVVYFVLGDIGADMIGICYLGELHHIACIGRRTHQKAWKKEPISFAEAHRCLRDSYQSYKPKMEDYLRKRQELLNRTDNKVVIPREGSRWSASDGYYGVSYSYYDIDSYYNSFLKEIEKMIALYELREKFLGVTLY